MEAKEYFEQGYSKQIIENYNEAIKNYDKVIELDKSFERAYIQRAFCRFKLKDFKSALNDFKTAMALNPNDARTYLNTGYILFEQNIETKDTFYLDKAIELNSDDMAEAYYIRGTIRYANLSQYELAIDDFTKAIGMDFCSDICYLRIADCYRCLDELDKALLNYYKVLELKPQSYYKAAALGNIGYIKHLYGLFEDAMKYYGKSKKTDPKYKVLDEYIEMCKQSLKEEKSNA